ncbi:MAG: outer membrane protein transport protein, partial [Myxococcales bacterium]|nr:outer membrane protein transport protein [Myxococcales bacterium]
MSQRRGQSWRSNCLRSGAAAALASAVLLSAGAAHASGFSVARFGSEHGTPMTTNGTSLYYNPGGFAASDGTHVFIDITAAWRSASYQHTEAPTDYSADPSNPDADLAREANTAEGSLFNVIPSPSAFVTTKLGDLGLALGFFTPFGGAAKWDKNDDFKDQTRYQGLYDGGQRWYTIDGQLRTSYLSLGVGYNLPDAGLSFGVSGNMLISLVQTLRARNVAGNDNIQREGRTYLDASGIDWSFGLGVRWAAPEDKVVVGASWQSAPNFNGEMRLNGTLTNVYGPQDALAGGSSGPTDFTTALPHVFRLGAEYKVNDTLQLRLFGDYQNWSVLEDQCVVKEGGTCDIQPDGSDPNRAGTVN